VGTPKVVRKAPGAVADGLELALFEGTGPGRSRGRLALEDLHPDLLVAGRDQPAFFAKARGIEVQLANVLGVDVGFAAVILDSGWLDRLDRLTIGSNAFSFDLPAWLRDRYPNLGVG